MYVNSNVNMYKVRWKMFHIMQGESFSYSAFISVLLMLINVHLYTHSTYSIYLGATVTVSSFSVSGYATHANCPNYRFPSKLLVLLLEQ